LPADGTAPKKSKAEVGGGGDDHGGGGGGRGAVRKGPMPKRSVGRALRAPPLGAAESAWDGAGREEGSDDDAGHVVASQRFLAAAKGGMEAAPYRRMMELLVAFDKEAIPMTKLIAEVTALLRPYPELEVGFRPFLPPTWADSGPPAGRKVGRKVG
jgi:hypothetical protein